MENIEDSFQETNLMAETSAFLPTERGVRRESLVAHPVSPFYFRRILRQAFEVSKYPSNLNKDEEDLFVTTRKTVVRLHSVVESQ